MTVAGGGRAPAGADHRGGGVHARRGGVRRGRADRPGPPGAGHGQPVRHADDQPRGDPLPAGPARRRWRAACRSRWPTRAPGWWAAPRSWSGGDDGQRPVPTVTEFRAGQPGRGHPAGYPPAARWTPAQPGRPAWAGAAAPGSGSGSGTRAGSGPGDPALASAPWLSPPRGRGHLAPHSDPAALPGRRPDRGQGEQPTHRRRSARPNSMAFPRPGDLAKGQTFLIPDDAFFSPNGSEIIATQEDDSSSAS